MPARPVNQPTKVPIVSPVKGVVRSVSAEQQPPETCPNALNVLPYDLLGRKRVAQRFGISEFTSTTQTGQIQGLLPIGYVVQPGAVIGDLYPITGSDYSPAIATPIAPGNYDYSFTIDPVAGQRVATWTMTWYPGRSTGGSPGDPTFAASFTLGNLITTTITGIFSTVDAQNTAILIVTDSEFGPIIGSTLASGISSTTTLVAQVILSASFKNLQYAATTQYTGELGTFTHKISGGQIGPYTSTLAVVISPTGVEEPYVVIA